MSGGDDRDLVGLIDRYAVRLGPEAVSRLAPAPEEPYSRAGGERRTPFADRATWERRSRSAL